MDGKRGEVNIGEEKSIERSMMISLGGLRMEEG